MDRYGTDVNTRGYRVHMRSARSKASQQLMSFTVVQKLHLHGNSVFVPRAETMEWFSQQPGSMWTYENAVQACLQCVCVEAGPVLVR